jgi:hypothetical protein
MGCALQVFSDQGKNFDSNLFRQVCELLQMAKARTTPYRPSSNGQVERMNREILAKLRIHIEGKQALWDQYLPYIGMAMRATVNRSTGFTPNMMMLGREVALPVHMMAAEPPEDNVDPAEYVDRLRDIVCDVHACAREKIGRALQARKRIYDQFVREDHYDTGDLVYLLNSATTKGVSRKLQAVYTGPFLVLKRISDGGLYLIVNSRGRKQVIHHDRMKRCSDRNIPLWARRERLRVLEAAESEEIPADPEDLDLSQFFDAATQGSIAPADPVPLPAGSQDNGSPDETSQNDLVSSTASQSQDVIPPPPLERRSSRRNRRQPAWLRDYIQ